jgi:hypothetical protein
MPSSNLRFASQIDPQMAAKGGMIQPSNRTPNPDIRASVTGIAESTVSTTAAGETR